jgi:hypothetical protein
VSAPSHGIPSSSFENGQHRRIQDRFQQMRAKGTSRDGRARKKRSQNEKSVGCSVGCHVH